VTGQRIALLSPYWDFFEYSVPGDLRGSRRALAARVAAAVGGVVADEVADSREAGSAAARRIAAAAPDVLGVVVSMAAPPAFALAALDALPDLPLVVLVLARRPPAAFGHADITSGGATVGGPQLTNVLARRGRPFGLVTAPDERTVTRDRIVAAACEAAVAPRVEDPAVAPRVEDPAIAPRAEDPAIAPRAEDRAVLPAGDPAVAAPDDALVSADHPAAAAVAARLRRARIARVGRPIDGYDCVDCDPAALRAATGIELVSVEPAAVRSAYLGADGSAVAAETRAGFEVATQCLARSARCAAALEALDERLGVDAGAMNCHVPEIRLGDAPGIAPCFALGRETSRGVPWTCSGDVVTAVAMLTLKLLAGAALFHEIEALDHASGEALLANSGEHDLALAGERPELVDNVWWPGACARFTPPPGPATLAAFTPHAGEPSGFRYVVAEGELTGRRLPATGTVNAAFRFAGSAPVAAAWERWARAGVNHHGAAAPGHHAAAVRAVAEHLGVGCVTTA
jgi:hypothetical protein